MYPYCRNQRASFHHSSSNNHCCNHHNRHHRRPNGSSLAQLPCPRTLQRLRLLRLRPCLWSRSNLPTCILVLPVSQLWQRRLLWQCRSTPYFYNSNIRIFIIIIINNNTCNNNTKHLGMIETKIPSPTTIIIVIIILMHDPWISPWMQSTSGWRLKQWYKTITTIRRRTGIQKDDLLGRFPRRSTIAP
jgi:hypothetical protein